MNKNYLLSYPVTFILASVLLFSVVAHSQELTEVQKKERCQNNKNRIVELETQLKVIDADFSASMTIKEMEDARNEMVFVSGIKNTVKSDIQRGGIEEGSVERNFSEYHTKTGIY